MQSLIQLTGTLTRSCGECGGAGCGCEACKGTGYVVMSNRGRYVVDESKVRARYHPRPKLAGRYSASTVRALDEGRVIQLIICPAKVGRLSPAHARRLAAE